MRRFLLLLLAALALPTAVNADPFTQMLKGGLKGGLKSESKGNYEKSFNLGKKCIKGNCKEIIGILSYQTIFLLHFGQ